MPGHPVPTAHSGRYGLALAVLACALEGCATVFVLPSVGERETFVSGWEAVARHGGHVVALFRTTTNRFPLLLSLNTTVASDVPAWGTVDLGANAWGDLDAGLQRLPSRLLEVERGAPPRIDAPPFEVVPLHRVPRGTPPDDASVADIRVAAGCDRPAAVVFPDRPEEGLMFVTADEGSGSLRALRLRVGRWRHRTWWAIPARCLLLPAAMVADVFITPWLILFPHDVWK